MYSQKMLVILKYRYDFYIRFSQRQLQKPISRGFTERKIIPAVIHPNWHCCFSIIDSINSTIHTGYVFVLVYVYNTWRIFSCYIEHQYLSYWNISTLNRDVCHNQHLSFFHENFWTTNDVETIPWYATAQYVKCIYFNITSMCADRLLINSSIWNGSRYLYGRRWYITSDSNLFWAMILECILQTLFVIKSYKCWFAAI